MIARHLPDPTDTGVTPHEQPGEQYIPLHFDDGDWVPPEDPDHPRETFGPYTNELDAVRAVVASLRRDWPTIERAIGIVRALCEHPEFAFEFDGISADMVHDRAVELSRLADEFDANIARLLEPPAPEDSVRIGPVFYRQNLETGRIEPMMSGRDESPIWQRRLRAVLNRAVSADEASGPDVAAYVITWCSALGDRDAAPEPDADEPIGKDDPAFRAFVAEWFARQTAPAETGSFSAFVAEWIRTLGDHAGVVAEPVRDPTTPRMSLADGVPREVTAEAETAKPEATEADGPETPAQATSDSTEADGDRDPGDPTAH